MPRTLDDVMSSPNTIHAQIRQMEQNLDDQAALIRQMANGMRRCFHELDKDLPDIDHAKDVLDQYYIGGRGKIRKAANGGARRS